MIERRVLGWPAAFKLVKLYSYITIGAVLYGIGYAHIPFIIGTPWSTCSVSGSALGCVLTVHLFEAPPALFNTYLAWYGLKRFAVKTVPSYCSLLTFAAAFNLVFFVFEIWLLLSGLQRRIPGWEIFGLASIAFLLIGGTGLTIYVNQKLIAASGDREMS